MAIVDFYGNIVTTDENSKLTVKLANSSFGGQFLPTLSGPTQFYSVKGIYTIENIVLTGSPGYSYQFSFNSDAIDQTKPAFLAMTQATD